MAIHYIKWENTGSYQWLVPNEPTNDLQIRLIGYDAVELTDTSEVGNTNRDYIKCAAISPDPGSIDFRNKF